MDLKFTFNGKGNDDHEHVAPGGRPLPAALGGLSLSAAAPAGGGSSELWVHVTVDGDTASTVAVSGDGVEYAAASTRLSPGDAEATARAVRSGVARALAALGEHLAGSIRGIRIGVPGGEPLDGASAVASYAALGVAGAFAASGGSQVGASDAACQRRTGVPAGTAIFAGLTAP